MAASDVVQHGRRKGTRRSASVGSGGTYSREIKPGQLTVVQAGEWDRIKAGLSRDSHMISERTAQHDARKALHLKSKAIVSNWENTIEGQRLKKLEARKLREEKEEEERVKVDEEEARYQAEKRREAIEKAKTMMYYQTDRVKQFHGALLLSEVLRERDRQVEYKNLKQNALKKRDEHYIQGQAEARKRDILEDIRLGEERVKHRDVVAKYQHQQRQKKAQAKVDERQLALEEQKVLDKEVEVFQAAERLKEQTQRAKKDAYRKELDASLSDKQAQKEQRKVEAEGEEEAIKVFAAAKNRMTTLRKEKERELFQQFQEQQKRMRQHLQGQQQQKSSDEDQRIAKAVAEQIAKRELAERQKEERFLQAAGEIHAHMCGQMEEQARALRQQEEMEQELLQQRILQDQKFHTQQLEKRQKAAREAKEVQEYHQSQMTEQAARLQADKEEQRTLTRRTNTLLRVEEGQFQEYAHRVITEARARGGHTQPLWKAAKAGAGGGRGPVFSGKGGIRPSYQAMDSTAVELPSYNPPEQSPEEEEEEEEGTSATPPSKNTQNRMGFTW